MVKIRQAIVVEGKYDQNTLSQLVDTTIFQTHGFGVMHDKALLSLLRRAAQTTGLIIFTDSDGAGFVIRNRIRGALPKAQVKHAYVPDICGKERRKRRPGREGKLGVEGMSPAVLEQALRQAGATVLEGDAPRRPSGPPLSKADLMTAGLSGRPDSAQRRLALLKQLALPEHMSANALLAVLNGCYSRGEAEALLGLSDSV